MLKKEFIHPRKIEEIDKLSAALLRQVELQIEIAQNFTQHVPEAERQALIARLIDTQRELLRFREQRLGADASKPPG